MSEAGAAAQPSRGVSVGTLVGQRVDVAGFGPGIVRFHGESLREGHYAGVRVGVVLDSANGLNDGTFQGVRYFDCAPGHGVMVRANKVDPVRGRPRSAPRTASAGRRRSVDPATASPSPTTPQGRTSAPRSAPASMSSSSSSSTATARRPPSPAVGRSLQAFQSPRTVQIRRNRARKGAYGMSLRGGVESGIFTTVVPSTESPPLYVSGSLHASHDVLLTINGRMVAGKTSGGLASDIRGAGDVIALGVCYVADASARHLATFMRLTSSEADASIVAIRRALQSADWANGSPYRASSTAPLDRRRARSPRSVAFPGPATATSTSTNEGANGQRPTAVGLGGNKVLPRSPTELHTDAGPSSLSESGGGGGGSSRRSPRTMPTLPSPTVKSPPQSPAAKQLEDGVLLELQRAMNEIITLRDERDAALAKADMLARMLDTVTTAHAVVTSVDAVTETTEESSADDDKTHHEEATEMAVVVPASPSSPPLPAVTQSANASADWAITTHFFGGSDRARDLHAHAQNHPDEHIIWHPVAPTRADQPVQVAAPEDNGVDVVNGTNMAQHTPPPLGHKEHAAFMSLVKETTRKDDPDWTDAWMAWGGSGDVEEPGKDTHNPNDGHHVTAGHERQHPTVSTTTGNLHGTNGTKHSPDQHVHDTHAASSVAPPGELSLQARLDHAEAMVASLRHVLKQVLDATGLSLDDLSVNIAPADAVLIHGASPPPMNETLQHSSVV
eukprot:m.15524 g.15524  ORF g.15524 m.15524 type:complete len:730 (-) comp3280_c0_seq1:23-2212(-)